MFKDYYAVLEVSPRASGDDIRYAFRRLALLYHPDRAQQPTTDTHSVVESNHAASSQPPSPPPQPLQSSSSHAPLVIVEGSSVRDFTDIQEAYEVLGDVARRYLYDMNYQEMLQYQEQQRRDEQARREAHQRAMEAAVLAASTAKRQRQAPHPSAINGVCSTSLQASQLQDSAREVPSDAVARTPPATTEKLVTEVAPEKRFAATTRREYVLEDVDGADHGVALSSSSSPSAVVYSSTAPLMRSGQRNHIGGNRGRLRLGNTTGRTTNTPLDQADATATTSSRLSLRQRLPHVQGGARALSSSTFLVTNSITMHPNDTASASSTVAPSRAAGGRPVALRGDAAEMPLSYYHQRSIERTLRVFFDAPESS